VTAAIVIVVAIVLLRRNETRLEEKAEAAMGKDAGAGLEKNPA
jgi:hypothetical protein